MDHYSGRFVGLVAAKVHRDDVDPPEIAEVRERVAMNLDRLRKKQQMSLNKLHKTSSVSKERIRLIRNHQKSPSIDILAKLATALKCDVSEFFYTDK